MEERLNDLEKRIANLEESRRIKLEIIVKKLIECILIAFEKL